MVDMKSGRECVRTHVALAGRPDFSRPNNDAKLASVRSSTVHSPISSLDSGKIAKPSAHDDRSARRDRHVEGTPWRS